MASPPVVDKSETNVYRETRSDGAVEFLNNDGFEDPAEWTVCINYGLSSPIPQKLLFNTKERSGMVPVKTAVAL